MLGVNEVPEPVMVRYFAMKKYLDKICAAITAFDLLRIAMDCGFDLETGLFQKKKPLLQLTVDEVGKTTKIEEEIPVAKLVDQAAAEGGSVEEVPQETIDEIIDEVDPNPAAPITDAVPDEPVIVKTEDIVDENAETKIEEVVYDNPAVEDGTTISFFVEGDPKTGIVKSHERSEASGEINYKVEVDGETVEISEDDIE
jgi:hypothetical protein